MKKFIWAILCMLIFSVAVGSTHAAAKDFKDVKKSHPNYEAIQYMQNKGFISGYPDGTFRPSESISRKHVAKLLDNALKLPQGNSSIRYYDVPTWHPYYAPIMKLTAAGIFSGGLDGYFNPEANITRIQMAKVLDIAFDLHMTKQNAFYDVYNNHWGYTHANAVNASGIASGYPEGEFRPNEAVTRAHYAQFLYAAIKVKNARPAGDKVTKGKAWDLVNRRSAEIERTMQEGRMKGLSYTGIQPALRASATKTFVESGLKAYYDKTEDYYSNVLPFINHEPVIRFEFTQPNANLLDVKTIVFQSYEATGSFVTYQFRMQDGKWKLNTLNLTPAGTKNFNLTIKEAEKVLKAQFLGYGHKQVEVKYVTTTKQVELDPVTDAKYTFDQYSFNVETEYGRNRVTFNSSDGNMNQ